MEVSVIIPSYNRADKAAACVAGLAGQSLSGERFEVLVGLDGGCEDPDGARAIERSLRAVWPSDRADRLTVTPCEKVGQTAVRNALLELARGETLVFLNDDMLPEPTLLEEHLRAQREAIARGTPALVIGAAPWVVCTPDSLFARLIRETSMVFFYDRMDDALDTGDADRDHDWGFRHAWLLNLSAPASLVREAGGFTVFPSTYGFEDDEFACRCAQRWGTPVLYRPEALAHHDHRLTPDDYLAREHRLGFAAWGFAHAAPACARAMFGRDITSGDELAYSRAYIARERAAADRARATLRELDETPADAAPPAGSPAASVVLQALAQQHLVLKRWEWRRGVLSASESEPRFETSEPRTSVRGFDRVSAQRSACATPD